MSYRLEVQGSSAAPTLHVDVDCISPADALLIAIELSKKIYTARYFQFALMNDQGETIGSWRVAAEPAIKELKKWLTE